MCLLDHPTISERYFFPRREACENPHRVPSGDIVLACYAQSPHPNGPTLVHFHGNGEVVADWVPDLSDAFVARGLNVFFAEYRGYGGSTGEPSLVSMLDDVDAVFAAVGRPARDIVVYGRSVGSIYAIEMVRRHPEVACLVLESAIADPLERVLMRVTPDEIGVSLESLREEAARTLDHRTKLASFDNPVLVLHARGDSLVDASNAERLASWCKGGADLRLYRAGDHNTMWMANGAAILEAVTELIASLPTP